MAYQLTPAGRAALAVGRTVHGGRRPKRDAPETLPAPADVRCLDGAARGPEHWCPNLARTGELFCEDCDPGGKWHTDWTTKPTPEEFAELMKKGRR